MNNARGNVLESHPGALWISGLYVISHVKSSVQVVVNANTMTNKSKKTIGWRSVSLTDKP